MASLPLQPQVVAAFQWMLDDLDTIPAAFSQWRTPPNVTMHSSQLTVHHTRPPFANVHSVHSGPPPIIVPYGPILPVPLPPLSGVRRARRSRIFDRLSPYGRDDGKNLEMGVPLPAWIRRYSPFGSHQPRV